MRKSAVQLTISMATHDDFDGVFFTIQSLRLHHDLPPDTEFLVLDNHPDSAHGRALAHYARAVPHLRVVPVTDRQSSFVKYDALALARGDVVLGLDCHVLLARGFFPALLGWFAAHPGSRDLLTGPLLYDDLRATSVKMNPAWRGHDYGTWGDDPAAVATGQPFEVPMQGMGCYAFARGQAPRVAHGFRGFGGEEWYVAEKVRRNGGRVMCHPALRWNHRFDWPARTFPLNLEDKVRNYYLGWRELYPPDDPMLTEMTRHWQTVLPPARVAELASLR